jgi:sec-independent protein translocase protein TatC
MPPVRESAKSKELLREMSFLEHLDDLRGVLIHSLLAFLITSIVAWFFSARILDLLVSDLPVEHLNFFAPAEAFMARLKMSFVVGGMAAFPYIAVRVWKFVAPALFDRERRRIAPLAATSSLLFYTGVLFCYIVLIPVVLEFLLGFGTEKLEPLLSVGAYFAMVARLCFTFGIVFQLPIIVLVLSLTGLVTPGLLLRQWRYAFLIIFVVAAILTPPDPASQVLMALPVILLYIGSVLVAHIAVKRREAADDDEDGDGAGHEPE